MTESAVIDLFKNITINMENGRGASVHKPLMLLLVLGRYSNGMPRLISFEEMIDEFSTLIEQFGSQHSRNNPHYPFWRLRNDGELWETTNTEGIYINEAGDVKKSELLERNAMGGVTKKVYDSFSKHKDLIFKVVDFLIENYFTNSLRENILIAVGINSTMCTSSTLVRDREFRGKILTAYEYRCAVCNFDLKLNSICICLEAAHVKWHSYGGPDTETNGLALCTMHHKLFDVGAFTISQEYIILVSENCHGPLSLPEWLLRFHRKNINQPQRKSYQVKEEFVQWHTKEVFRGTPRD